MKPARIFLYLLLLSGVVFFSCKREADTMPVSTQQDPGTTAAIYAGWPETFETGTKGAYAAADVTLSTGSWNLADALLGTSTSDRKSGTKSVRIQNTGTVTMNFNVTGGASQVTIKHAVYGSDASSTWELWYSTNSGSSWTKTGSTVTTSSTTLNTQTFNLTVSGNIRFQLRKLSGGRLNIDDFSINDNSSTVPTRDDNMALGNPSGATTNTSNTNNYLMVKTQYALAYNNSRGTANWVSWHLSTAWKGSAQRCDCFSQDVALPSGYYRASTSNYTNTGFDRGHMCPSEDRDGSDADNRATFLMTNIIPQSPINNQQTWKNLEDYCRTLMNAGNELYIIAGSYGQGGTGSQGGTTNTIASGNITVPSRVWKVVVVLPVGSNDLSRISTSTRVIAVDMPNIQSVNAQPWGYYRTSVNAIETATGYDVMNLVSTSIQNTIESTVDSGPTQ